MEAHESRESAAPRREDRPPEELLATYEEVGEHLGLKPGSIRRTWNRKDLPRWSVQRGSAALNAVSLRDVAIVFAERLEAVEAAEVRDIRDIRPRPVSVRDSRDSDSRGARDVQDIPDGDVPDVRDSRDEGRSGGSGGAPGAGGLSGPSGRGSRLSGTGARDTRDTAPEEVALRSRLEAVEDERDRLEQALAAKDRSLNQISAKIGELVGERNFLAARLEAAEADRQPPPVGEGASRALTLAGILGLVAAAVLGVVAWIERGEVQARERGVQVREEASRRRDADLVARGAELGSLSRALGQQAEAVEAARAENALGLQLVEAHRQAVARDLRTTLLDQQLGPAGVLREIILAGTRLATGR